MSSLKIYNTNGILVYSSESASEKNCINIQPFIDNVVEFCIDTNKSRIIALIQANAPQVKGRDKANFHVVFENEDPVTLPASLVSELKKLANRTNWEFYTTTPRLSVPWLVAQNEDRTPESLDLDIGPLFTVRRLIEEQKPLDFGFTGFEQATQALSYFLKQRNKQATYAIASNERKGPIRSAELVLVPGRTNNFKILTPETRDRIATKSEALRSETESYYLEDTSKLVEAVVTDPGLTPIQSLEELHRLERYFCDPDKSEFTESSFQSKHGREALARMVAIRDEDSVRDTPPLEILDQRTRDEIVSELRDSIASKRKAYDDNIDEKIREAVNQHLSQLGEERAEFQFRELNTIEERLSEGGDSHQSVRLEPAEKIFEVIDQIESSNILDRSKKHSLTNATRNAIKERKTELRDETEKNLNGQIQTWTRNLPSPDSAQAVTVAGSIGALQAAVRNPGRTIPTEVLDSEQRDALERLVESIHSSEILHENQRTRLQRTLCNELAEYESDVVAEREDELRAKVDDHIKWVKEAFLPKQQHEIFSEWRNVFDQFADVDNRVVASFRDISEEIENEEIFSASKKKQLKSYMCTQLEDREKTLREQEVKRYQYRIKSLREEAIESALRSGDRTKAIELVRSVERYLDGRASQSTLPEELDLSYRRRLRTLSGDDEHEILVSDDIKEIKSRVAESRSETLKELREQELTSIRNKFETNVKRLFRQLNDDPTNQINVFRSLLDYLRPKSSTTSNDMLAPDPPQGFEERVQTVLELIKRTRGTDRVLSREHQKDLRQDFETILDSFLETAMDELVEERVQEVTTFIRSQNTGPDAGIEEIEESIDTVETIRRAVKEQRTIAELPDEVETYIQQMTGDFIHRSYRFDFGQQIVSQADDVLDDLRQQRFRIGKSEIETKITEVTERDGSLKYKIERLQTLARVVNPKSASSESNVSSAFISTCRSLSQESRQELHSRIQEQIQTLSQSLTEHIVQDVISSLNDTLKKTDHPDQAIETFESYLHDETTVGSNNLLFKVCKEYVRLKELYGDNVIDEDQFERARQELLDELSELKSEHGTDSKLAELVRSIKSILSNTLPITRLR
ncbi:hypothetical protein [Haloarcula amylovorans]|uniref:hypothetical protein n=1 Tax=Haloarcula amylovorans TaxID=2562280 RepID=UPI001075FFCF|nr:hypothetical protein [Halomicroarcula amylolytica]